MVDGPDLPIDVRNPEQAPLAQKRREELRKGFPGLDDAWRVFHGNEKLSAEAQKLVQNYYRTHPDAIDPQTHKIRASGLQELQKSLRDRDSFEVIAFNNQAVSAFERARLQMLPSPLDDQNRNNLLAARNSEMFWKVTPRLIRHALRTHDRYTVIRGLYTYDGLQPNAKLEAQCQAQLTELSQIMQARIKARSGDRTEEEVQEKRLRQLLISLTTNANNLYTGFINDALQRNMKIRQEGNIPRPRFEQLELQGHELLYEAHSFLFHGGLYSIRDMQIFALPELGETPIELDQPLDAPFNWGTNTRGGREFATMNIAHITRSFQNHFHDVLGEPREDGTRAAQTGLFEITAGIRLESLWTRHSRDRMLRLCNSLVLYQGGVDWAVGTGARAATVRLADLVNLGGAADAALPTPQNPEEYRKKIMNPVLVQMGLPEGFDFSEAAWKALEDNPAAKERFEKRIEEVQKILEETEKTARASIEVCRTDLTLLPVLQTKVDPERIRNTEPDQVWLKAIQARDGGRGCLTMADLNGITTEDPGKVLAAHVLLFDQMMDHWGTYNACMNNGASRILRNVDTHAKTAEAARKAAAESSRDWILYTVFGVIGYAVAARYLGRFGRYGGVSGTAGAVGIARNNLLFRTALSPFSIINGVARPTGIYYLFGERPPVTPSTPAIPTATLAPTEEALRIEQIAANNRVAAALRNTQIRKILDNVRGLEATEGTLSVQGRLLLDQQRFEAARLALNRTAVLTVQQQQQLLQAHNWGIANSGDIHMNATKIRMLMRNNAFTMEEALILAHQDIRLAGRSGFALTTAAEIAPQAGRGARLLTGVRGAGRLLGPALRYGGGAVAIIMEGMELDARAQEFSRLNSAERRTRLQAELDQGMRSSGAFTSEGNNQWRHSSTGRVIDLGPITRITDEQLMVVTADMIIASGGLTAAVIGMLATGPIGWVALIGSIVGITVARAITERQREEILTAASHDLPPHILAAIPLSSLFETANTTLFERVISGARRLPSEQYYETLNRFAFSAIANEMRNISPIPLHFLNKGNQDWIDRLWADQEELGGIFSHPDNYRTEEQCQAVVRAKAYEMLQRYMCLEFVNARDALTTLEESRKKLPQDNQEGIRKIEADILDLRLRIQFFGGLYFSNGMNVAQAVDARTVDVTYNRDRSSGSARGVHIANGRIVDMPLPHEFGGAVEQAGVVRLQLHGAYEEMRNGVACFVVDGTGPASGKKALFSCMSGHWYWRIDEQGARWSTDTNVFNRTNSAEERFARIASALHSLESTFDRRESTATNVLLRPPSQPRCVRETREGRTVYVYRTATEISTQLGMQNPRVQTQNELVFTYASGQWLYMASAPLGTGWMSIAAPLPESVRFSRTAFRQILGEVVAEQKRLMQEAETYDQRARLFGDVMSSLPANLFQDGLRDDVALRTALFQNPAQAPAITSLGIHREDLQTIGAMMRALEAPLGNRSCRNLVLRGTSMQLGGIEYEAIIASAIPESGSPVYALALREQGTRGPFVISTGNAAPSELRTADITTIDRMQKERTEKERRQRDEKLEKEFGETGRMHNARLAEAPMVVSTDSDGNRTWQMRVGNDVALVRINFDGTVIGFTLIPHLGTPPLTWAERENKYYEEIRDKYLKQFSAIVNEKGERESVEKRARAEAQAVVKKEREESEQVPQGSLVSAGERKQIAQLEKALEAIRKTNNGNITGPAGNLSPETQKILGTILNAVPGESVGDYVNSLLQQNRNAMGPSLASRISQVPGLPTRREVEARMTELYRELCTGQAQGQDGQIPGDTIGQRARFNAAVSRALQNVQFNGQLFQFDRDISLDTLAIRIQSEI